MAVLFEGPLKARAYMPSAASSFLLLRFLCRYKENDVAVGNPDGSGVGFVFDLQN